MNARLNLDDLELVQSQLIEEAALYFETYLKRPFDNMIQPFDEASPCGPDLRTDGLFSEIANARRADDPSLPRGDWQIELKKSDWGAVSRLTGNALAGSSKDIQLCAWLLEAEIRQRGFAAIGPALTLMTALLDRFWRDLNPAIDELERRYNIFRWIDEKIPHAVNQIAIAVSLDDGDEYSGFDLERAREWQHLIDSKQIDADEQEGPSLQRITEVASRAPKEGYIENFVHLDKALSALDMLDRKLDELFGQSDAPGFSELRAQLQASLGFVESELKQRGALADAQARLAPRAEEQMDEQTEDDSATSDNAQENQNADGKNSGLKLDRQNAYQQLADIAHYLAGIEPHSPVPYLVMRAVEWGGYNTAELYQDLFLVNKGQLDLFEIMGITGQQEDASASA